MRKHLESLNDFVPLAILAALFFILAVLASIFTGTPLIGWLSIMMAIFLYFFIPGYLSLLFLEISATERVVFSFFAGGIITALVLYFLNIFGMTLSRFTVYMTILCISVILIVAYVFFRKDNTKKETKKE